MLTLIAVVSSAGGAGRSTVTAHLAEAVGFEPTMQF